ncbi:SIMPL domain-containing protein [Aureisphaera galaxeae]|uniref:SIMPL domain-containing protein n=1 Tax=Aureisphaera galaxeae TaxID=1538023 RepID=UPI002350B5AF|nr:SIMPL domain-containing protein [Aureisphaera galaxeae]MDC8003692.1 SIMPL domain-containing protein [Aureisphaera galaxeae]
MKKLLFFALFLLTCNVFSQNQNFLEKPYLETSATYTTEVIPDRIYLSITISEKDTRGKISVEELETRMMVKLKAIGIDTDKQLFLSDLDSDFRKYLLRKTDILKNKSYTLLVYDGKTAGQVMRELELINISNIGLEKYEYSKFEELKIELRGKAVSKAKRQANAILQPLQQKTGKVLFASDIETTDVHLQTGILVRGANSYRSRVARGYGIKNETYIGFKQIKVQAEVTVCFEIL